MPSPRRNLLHTTFNVHTSGARTVRPCARPCAIDVPLDYIRVSTSISPWLPYVQHGSRAGGQRRWLRARVLLRASEHRRWVGSWVPPLPFAGKKIERKHLQPNGLLFATLPCGFGTRLPGFYAPLPCGFFISVASVSVDRLPKMAMPGRNAGISAQWAGIGEGFPGTSYLVSPA